MLVKDKQLALSLSGRAEGAFIGAILGDVIGWPMEDVARRLKTSKTPTAAEPIISWTKKKLELSMCNLKNQFKKARIVMILSYFFVVHEVC